MKRMSRIGKALLVVAAALTLPKLAFAYVDPGVLAVLYQALYVAVFGALAAFIFRPWNYLKSLFKKTDASEPSRPESDSQKDSR